MDYWTLLYNYNLVLWAIVGTSLAAKTLRKWSIQFLNRDPSKAAEKAAEKARKVREKLETKAAKLKAKAAAVPEAIGDAVDDARDAVADKLRDTADAVDSDEET